VCPPWLKTSWKSVSYFKNSDAIQMDTHARTHAHTHTQWELWYHEFSCFLRVKIPYKCLYLSFCFLFFPYVFIAPSICYKLLEWRMPCVHLAAVFFLSLCLSLLYLFTSSPAYQHCKYRVKWFSWNVTFQKWYSSDNDQVVFWYCARELPFDTVNRLEEMERRGEQSGENI
jgi:hypothetical protein